MAVLSEFHPDELAGLMCRLRSGDDLTHEEQVRLVATAQGALASLRMRDSRVAAWEADGCPEPASVVHARVDSRAVAAPPSAGRRK